MCRGALYRLIPVTQYAQHVRLSLQQINTGKTKAIESARAD